MDKQIVLDNLDNQWSELEEKKPKGYEYIQNGIEMAIQIIETLSEWKNDELS